MPKLYVYKENVFIDGERQIYSTCDGPNSFFSSKTQKKILSNDMAENMSVVSLPI